MHALFIIWTKSLSMNENPIDLNDNRKTALPHFSMRCPKRDKLRMYVMPSSLNVWSLEDMKVIWCHFVCNHLLCGVYHFKFKLGFPNYYRRECMASSEKLALEYFCIRGYIYTIHIFSRIVQSLLLFHR